MTTRSLDQAWTRRELLKAGLAASVGGPLVPGSALAVPPIVLFLGGLVLGEVVLGVLRAYGIDIGRATEEIVRGVRSAKRYEPEIQMTQVVVNQTYITRMGVSPSGCLQLGSSGVGAAEGRRAREAPKGYWVPGELLFVATLGDTGRGEVDLAQARCGYPVQVHRKDWTDKNYFTASQQFREGLATVVVDQRHLPSIGEYAERPFSEVLLDHSWRPSPA